MTMMEHLFMQIFDRKAWIESQLRQQSEAYSESLSYNLLADGGWPPPWLWDAGSDAPGCSGREVLSREQFIQGMLLPLPRATTPMTKHNTIYFNAPFSSTHINQRSSLVSEIFIPNGPIHPENIDVAGTVGHHKDDQVDPDMLCSEVVEDSSVFASHDNTQCCRSRQRSPENDSKFGDMRIGDQHAHRTTRSMASSFMPDHVRELSVSKNSFDLHSKNGDTAAPSRPLDHFDSTLKPSIPSGFISNKATAGQKNYMPSILRKTNDLRINHTHDASVRECCIGVVGKEFASNGSKFVDPGCRTTPSSASMLSKNQSLVVTKKLSFDGIDVCALDENTHGSFPPTENFCCSSEGWHEKLKSVQSLKEHPILKDSMHASGAIHVEMFVHPEAAQSAEVAASSSMEKERIESRCKLYEKFTLLSKEAKKLSSGIAMSHSSPPLMLSSCLNSPGNKSLHYGSCPGSPSGSLIEQSKEQQSEPTTSTQSNIGAARQPHISSDVEPMHLSDKIKYCELNKAGATASEENIGSSLQTIKDGELHMNTKTILGSPRQNQLHQEDILPAVESPEKVFSRTHSCEKQSDRTMEHLMKDSCTGTLVKKSVCSLDQLTHAQSDKSVPLEDEVFLATECTKFVTGDIGRTTVSKPTLVVHNDESFPASIGHQHLISSPTSSDVSRLSDSASHCSNDHQLVFLEKESVVDYPIRDVPDKTLTEKLPNASKMEENVSYILRSSTRAMEDFGACKENSEKMKDENFEKIVNTVEKSIVRPPSVGTHNRSSEARYCLRSLNRHDKTHTYSDLNGTSNATSSKRSRKRTEACSWPKRRKLNCHSDGILATTPRIRLHQEDILGTSKRSSKSVPLEETQTIPSPDLMLTSNVDKADLGSNSEDHHPSRNKYERKDASCLKNKGQVMDIPWPIQSTNALPSPNLANRNSRTSLMNEICNSQCAAFNFGEYDTSGNDTNDRLTCMAAKSYCHGLQSIDKQEVCDSDEGLTTYDAPVLSNLKDFMVGSDEFMPEFEGFSVGISPNGENDISCDSNCPPSREEQISLDVKQGISIDLVTPKVHPSGNYKINKLPDAYQSLPTGLLEHMNLNDSLNFDSDNIREFWTSEQEKMSGFYSSLGSDSAFHYDFVERSYNHNTSSSGARSRWRGSKPPLTPPIEKSSLRKVSGKSGSSSQTLGTNPELVCFRIDEYSSTVEDNENSDKFGTSEEGISARGTKVREPLQDVSSIYKNVPTMAPLTKTILERASLEFLHGTESNVDSSNSGHIEYKEHQYLSVNANKERKVIRSLQNRSSESEINVQASGRNKSQASTQKSCKPNNIVSNVSSFIPMVQKKQQATTTKGKKDIKVKALEAAEAAKRLEEKKQNEREMRKAAAKLERERLEQEKQVKQKQLEEEKRRKVADIAARKRQREEEEKKEKERKRQEKEAAAAKLERERLEQEKQAKQKQLEEEKRRKEADIAARKRQREEEEERKEKQKKRRCIEETRKLQREQEERLLAKKEEKDVRLKAAINDGKNRGIVQEAKQLLKSGEAAGSRNAEGVEPAATEEIINFDSMKGKTQDRMSSSKEIEDFQSYDISPYKDSDDEDGEEENIRRMKQIPSWARRESLDKSLLLQQDLDPLEIFSRKSSFSLSEVLHPAVARRWPL